MHQQPTTTLPEDRERLVPRNFITDVIDADLRDGRVSAVVTRFPPEPNGYLHIGHVKAIALAFGLARDYGGRVHLRMDDTNPTTEDPEYVRAIQEDVRWLGFEWDELRYASDYFEELYRLARRLIADGRAYVDSRSEDEIRRTRGTVTEPGTPSPYRDRDADENLDLFARMRAGEFPDGAHVLRARADMASANMVMRDPVLYRIKHAHHYRSGDAWPIYPLYDFAHPLSDAIEGVTHSLCSLEFENNRAIYDWLVEALFPEPRPRQYEFARLALDHTVLSKRRLITLVQDGHVHGWDDPRLPTVAALRRRGMPAEAVRDFALRVGVTKTNSRTDPALLETTARDHLNATAPRALAVVDPLEVELHGLPDGVTELPAPSFPDDAASSARRTVPIGARIVIERDDFQLEPEAGFKRLAPGRSVRLRHAFVVTCREVVRDSRGEVARIVADVVPDSLGATPAGLRVWAAIHWVDAERGVEATFRQVERLFEVSDPAAAAEAEDRPFTDYLNRASLLERRGVVEPSVLGDAPDTRYQFERLGYFWRDPIDGRGARPVFTRIVPLKDGWGRTRAEARPRRERPPGTGDAGTGPDPLERLDPAARSAATTMMSDQGLAAGDAAVIAADDALRTLFADAVAAGADARTTASWIVNELRRPELAGAHTAVQGAELAELLGMISDGSLTVVLAREALEATLRTGVPPAEVARQQRLQVLPDDDPVIIRAIAEALAAHPAEREAYRGGKRGLLGFFVGAVMRATGGRADPRALRSALERALDQRP